MGKRLAARLKLSVAHDFRAADVAAGGQGAPLVPVFHQALARELDRPHPMAVLNLGGVANVTFVDGGDPIACDTGPGNALIDDFMRARTGAPYDNHGDAAADGKPDQSFIDAVLADPFFELKTPKSLDRNAFAFGNIGLPNYSVADGAATLSALTVQAVGRIVPHLPAVPKAWIVAGGGARNRTLMKMLQQRLAPATVETADQAGWSSDALEAQAFAYLAVRTLNDLPITFPKTTGAPKPLTGRRGCAALGRGTRQPAFRLQKRRAKSGVEQTIIIGDLLALADVAAGNDVAVTPMGVGVVRMVHVVIVVDGQQHFAIDPVAVILDVVARRLWQLGELLGRVDPIEALDESPDRAPLRINSPAKTPSP